jgi:hypothetical protein
MMRLPPIVARHALPLAAIALAVTAALTLTACNILAPAAYFLGGTGKVDAEYELNEYKTVVFVDDRGNVIASNAPALRLAIADQLVDELIDNKALPAGLILDPRDAQGLVRSRDRHGELLPIDEIGRLVGADQIIYIEMIQFALTPDGVTPTPTAACRMRVIDVANRKRLFPDPEDTQQPFRQVSTKLQAVDPQLFESRASRVGVYKTMAAKLGRDLGKIFYRHEAVDLGERLQPR